MAKGRPLTEEHKQKLRDAVRKPKPKRPPEERFMEKVEKRGGHWIWTARQSHGYGYFSAKRAHRVAYEMFVGPIPEGHHLHHACGVKLCVKPKHLVPMLPIDHQPLHDKWENRRWHGSQEA